MVLYFFGFNGFKCVPLEPSTIENVYQIALPPVNYLSFAVSWSSFFGVRGDGQLHIGRTGGPGPPVESWLKKKFRNVACSDSHAVAITSDNGHGLMIRLHPDCQFREIPELKERLEAHEFVDCDVGDSDAVFLSSSGRVIWIDLKSAVLETQILPLAFRVVEVSCGGKEHVILLNEHGTVYTFGTGSRGQLGHGDLENEDSPRPVECLEGIRVRNIAAGGWHSAAVSYDGDLYTWGWNESGQLGFPTSPDTKSNGTSDSVTVQATPIAVDFPDGVLVASVSCGTRHTLVKTVDGCVWAFGWNAHGQLGVETCPFVSVPTKLRHFDGCRVSSVQCQAWSSVVMVDDPS